MNTFGERLRDAMLIAGCSVSALARHCGVSRTTVQTWRKMDRPKLSVEMLLTIDARLNVNLRWLASGKASPVPMWKERLQETE